MESAHLKLTDQIIQDQETPRTTPPVHVNPEGHDVLRSDDAPSSNAWTTSTPQSQAATPPMTTGLDGFSYSSLMDLASQHQQQPHPTTTSMGGDPGSVVSIGPMSTGSPSRPISSQDFQTPSSLDGQLHAHKHLYENQYALQALTSDMPIGPAYTSDEVVPIVDAETSHHGVGGYYGYPLSHDDVDSRRISGSSFTMSTCGAMSDMAPYEDISAAMSDAQSDYHPPTTASTRTSWMSSSHLSPLASPRMSAQNMTGSSHGAGSHRPELVRTQSRGRASPSPRPSVRSAPYSIDGSQRNRQRWSTGTYSTGNNNRRHSPYYMGPESHVATTPPFQRESFRHPVNTSRPSPPNRVSSQASYLTAPPRSVQRKSMLLPTQLPSQLPSQLASQPLHGSGVGGDMQSGLDGAAPSRPLSQDFFRMLHSNADSRSVHQRRYTTDLSDPPDLFGYLSEEPCSPPEEDMNPSDPDMVPREQDLRFDGDLYTPKWVRGHGNKREGWCGICKPGRWLVLKNSAYWYDKSFSHGISAATGSPFQEPLDSRRTDGNPDVWEGLCGGCNDWIALVSSKKKGTTWFRHAYKCHSHPKAKDGAKRRRENSNVRLPPAPLGKSSRLDQQQLQSPYHQPQHSPYHQPQPSPYHSHHQQFHPGLSSPYVPGMVTPSPGGHQHHHHQQQQHAGGGGVPPPTPMTYGSRHSNPTPMSSQVQMAPALYLNDMYPNMI
ncbi:hypothetical protein GMORB2_2095 [Geosmithia morbida]|uniref:Transcription regulator Rua1 C-terminal domain-containing protein n=1 Tax=Geosmithia morbida TaxID=1094350 RepID=A0A9P4YQ91_9HYPO|nr:uncharacterized protein GMORB2_2095 [Geosmithia morbida]KAF4121133.1 hypothetical protein GMORB2_2095 [Geosmithia morbida]